MTTYDRIGQTYATGRRPDPRVEAQIHRALGEACSVVNVGAGTGSYEPADRTVVAVEPSATMRRQRRPGAAPCVAGVAESLPFTDGSFDVAMTVLSIHHWTDVERGLTELRRVARRQVVLSYEPVDVVSFWLVDDYLPEIGELAVSRPPRPAEVLERLGGAGRIEVVPVPADCVDGFQPAHWQRPEAYLDPAVRACASGLALLPDDLVAARMARLAADLADGSWHRRHGHLLDRAELDTGFRLVVAEGGGPGGVGRRPGR
ncbi:MAG: class I SAM-dependent methyltransferase [Acidimicrobiales bacterium]|nr:class I SAM-dependent methyltransferase [Acidimicrobiales bacterium]HRW37616.1 class I SAM-dependent methyltransferase [Aquihabitans sp.]